jgi:RNA polymerase-binding transcription factor DksA
MAYWDSGTADGHVRVAAVVSAPRVPWAWWPSLLPYGRVRSTPNTRGNPMTEHPSPPTVAHTETRDVLRRLERYELERISRSGDDVQLRAGTQLGILDAVRAALERLDVGTYGLCSSCGGWIEPMRLEVLPYAQRCIKCQAGTERSDA